MTNAWSYFDSGNPLPLNVDGWTNTMLTGPTAGFQLYAAKFAIDASDPS